MSREPCITGPVLIAALENGRFEVARRLGDHAFLRHVNGHCTVVPVHKGEKIGRGLMAKILHDADITRDELLNLL
jgi:predicted RNA binding protein YcfA (HicA-like mRNA interferase family)